MPAHADPQGWHRWLPAAVGVFGLLLTTLSLVSTLRSSGRLQQLRRDQALNAVSSALRTRLESNTASLQGLAAHFDAVSTLGQGPFTRYLERIRLQTDALEVGQPIAWIEKLGDAPARLRLLDPSDMPRQQRMALQVMLQQPAAIEAMNRSRDAGRPLLSEPLAAGPYSLEPNDRMLLLLLPLYREGKAPATLQARRVALRGWFLLPLQPDELVNGAIRVSEFQLNEPVDVQLFAAQSPTPARLIHDTTRSRPPAAFSSDDQRPIDILGVRWLLATRLPWLERVRSGPWDRVLTSGLLLTGLLTVLSHRLVRQSHRIQVALDVADRAHAQEADARGELRISTEAFRQIEEGVAITDLEGRLLQVNDAFCRLVGSSREALLSRKEHLLACQQGAKVDGARLWATVIDRGSWQGELWIQPQGRSASPAWLNIQTIRDAEGRTTRYMGVLSDLSQLQEKDDRLNYLGYHDPLTDLPNMRKARLELEGAMGREASGLEIFWLDLDGFKRINDGFGHDQGDLVLSATAARLRSSLAPGELLARIGSDEFLVILRKGTKTGTAISRAQELIRVVRQALPMREGLVVELNACCGISLFPEHGHDPGELLQFAATALTEAKQLSPGTVRAYDPRMTRESLHRLRIESELQFGIEHGELSLMFQPQTDGQGVLLGAECLLRWHNVRLGQVSPGVFIPIAEASGLIHRIGRWVLEATCQQIRQWREQGLEVPPLAVNVSNLQFQEANGDLPTLVAELLAASGLQGEEIELEITESCLLAEIGALEKMRRLEAMGIPIAVDDFGTGFSSLSVLHQFPIHKIKIDRSFISSFDRRESSRAIVKSTLAMARELGLITLAEGPERAEEVALLNAYGCDQFQGYYFSRPLSLEDFTALLSRPDRRLPQMEEDRRAPAL
ncbi:EAL domain-containing protein [Synechococcus sp. CCY 9618]|uniref:bifunctional diguanylate cyclase/phosphodiesterase n=1 Tax=Synechococcus sp. CCY 9618 TaxID=2815602 RepID=UPI001C248BB5|nr:EAL domain-containing protein [Synechococcus sp. CCY 9618]